VATGIFSGHRKGRVSFFCEADLELNSLAGLVEDTATPIYDQRILSINEISMFTDQLLYRFLKRLFIPCKRND